MRDSPHCLQNRSDYLVKTFNGIVILFLCDKYFWPLGVDDIKLRMRMKARADRIT